MLARKLPWAEEPRDFARIEVDGTHLVLFHYGMRTWPGSRRGVLHLYGHSHGNLPDLGHSTDVGVDAWGYRPVDLPTLRARFEVAPTHDEDAEQDLQDDMEEEEALPSPFAP